MVAHAMSCMARCVTSYPPCVSTTSLRRCVTRQQRWTKANKTNHATIHRRNRRKCMWQMYTHKPAHHYKYKGQCKTKNKICMMVCVLNSKNMRATPHSNFEVVDELRKNKLAHDIFGDFCLNLRSGQ